MKTITIFIGAFLLLTSVAFAQGAKASFKDPRDGQVYGVKKVGNLTWMKQNLGYDMRDDSICYDDDDEWCSELGMLYTFDGALKACPIGWRLPTDADWMDLEKALGMPQNQLTVDGYSTQRGTNEGQKLKVGGSSGLEFKISGFATLGGDGPSFGGINDDRPRSYFWTATSRTVKGQTNAYRRRIEAKNGNIFRFSNPTAGYAVSVRCVQ
ncbi:MAG: FISUMP domain-containing protein [Pyrinomonadaceae bacterium]